MKKREIVLSIIILVVFVLVTICTVKTSNIGRRVSALEVERNRPCNVSVSVMCIPTLPSKEDRVNLTIDDIGQDHLQANNQLGSLARLENVTYPLACASRWLQNAITVEEILHCIEDYTRNEQLRMQGQSS